MEMGTKLVGSRTCLDANYKKPLRENSSNVREKYK